MSSIFDKQVINMQNKLETYANKVKHNPMLVALSNKVDCKEMFLSGSDEVKLELLRVAKQEFIGKVTPVAYASTVVALANLLGVAVEAQAGVCFPNNYPKREEELAIFNDRRKNNEHPLVPNAVVITLPSDVTYEYFNGFFSSEHVDLVKLNLV